jgi:hypothetical protein
MNIITATLDAMRVAFDKANAPHLSPEEQYLAQAQDMADLEHRIHELEEHRGEVYIDSYLAIYPAGSGR